VQVRFERGRESDTTTRDAYHFPEVRDQALLDSDSGDAVPVLCREIVAVDLEVEAYTARAFEDAVLEQTH